LPSGEITALKTDRKEITSSKEGDLVVWAFKKLKQHMAKVIRYTFFIIFYGWIY
jgi:hypothetical protein